MEGRFFIYALLAGGFFVLSCTANKKQPDNSVIHDDTVSVESFQEADTVVVDSRYSFDEAIAGTKAPKEIIEQLELFDVTYLSTDEKIHRGQILTNKKLSEDIRAMFAFMLERGFVVEKAVPVVRYNWNDSLSMNDNNTYSFCYRNISYSKHARGMAIDINPQFNPVRWKKTNRPNQPEGAVSDTAVNGTFYPEHAVVKEFQKRGFRWGHAFSKYYDDHHFEKR